MTEFKILGYNYSLDHTKPLAEMEGNAGLCDFDRLKIDVASDLADDMAVSVLLHEIIEAINYHLELKMKHNQIMGMETGLHQALVENGVDLAKLLRKE